MALGADRSGEPTRPLPRGLLGIFLPLAALALVVLFVLILFPYERFRDIIVSQLAQATGATVSLGDLEGGLSAGGPSLLATELVLRWPGRQELRLERARVRPAWSLSWLRGAPALRVDLRGPVGNIAGTLWPASTPAFSGWAHEIELARLPLQLHASPLALAGTLDAEIELGTGPGGPRGELRFESRDGSIAAPQLPFAIPYEQARGALLRDESGSTRLRQLELSGPMIWLAAEGSIAPSRRLEDGALDLEIELRAVDPGVRSMIQDYGIRLDPDGATKLHLSGSVSRPLLR